jgi:hypothetical protein
MELKEFVSQTLVQITQGVVDAQAALLPIGARVNPKLSNLLPKGEKSYGAFAWAEGEGANPVLLVKFDVAVTTTEETKTKGGIGVVAGIVSLGTTGATDKGNSAASRIVFEVPLMLPLQPKG